LGKSIASIQIHAMSGVHAARYAGHFMACDFLAVVLSTGRNKYVVIKARSLCASDT